MRLLLLASIVALVLMPRAARACSCGCPERVLLPRSGASVPANLPAFHWEPVWVTVPSVNEDHVSLRRTTDQASVSVSVEESTSEIWLVHPHEPLDPGVTYELVVADFCGGSTRADESGISATLHASEAAALPDALGELLAGEPSIGMIELADIRGSCSWEWEAAHVDVELILDESARPWADMLAFETLVDDEPWRPMGSICHMPLPGESWKGRGRDTVYRVCDGGQRERTVSIEMRARIPGQDLVLTSGPVEVLLQCNRGCGCQAELAPNGHAWLATLLIALLRRRDGEPAGPTVA